MTLTRWQRPDFWGLSPLRRVASLRDEVDSLFNLAFGHLVNAKPDNGQGSQLPHGLFPAVDVYEDNETLLVKAELPGLKKEDISISLDNGNLTLSGERKQEEKHQDAGVYRSERWVGRFNRVVSLPFRVDAEKIKASYSEGVLTVTLPKAEDAKSRQIPISVN